MTFPQKIFVNLTPHRGLGRRLCLVGPMRTNCSLPVNSDFTPLSSRERLHDFVFICSCDKVTFVASFEVGFTFHFAALFTFFGGTVFPRQGRVGRLH